VLVIAYRITVRAEPSLSVFVGMHLRRLAQVVDRSDSAWPTFTLSSQFFVVALRDPV
jgi:hypothetical protein